MSDPEAEARQLIDELSAGVVREIALSDLPFRIRQVEDFRARLTEEWSLAWGNACYQRRSLSLFYHQEDKLGITAAQMKADLDPVIADARALSLRLKNTLDQLDHIARHLRDELTVKASGMG